MNPTAGGVLTPTTSSADSRSESRIFINPTGFEKITPIGPPQSQRPQPIDGQELLARIEKALSRNPYVPKRHLHFEAHGGRVILRGVVRSYFQKQMAQEALRHVEGIEEICNELEVAGR